MTRFAKGQHVTVEVPTCDRCDRIQSDRDGWLFGLTLVGVCALGGAIYVAATTNLLWTSPVARVAIPVSLLLVLVLAVVVGVLGGGAQDRVRTDRAAQRDAPAPAGDLRAGRPRSGAVTTAVPRWGRALAGRAAVIGAGEREGARVSPPSAPAGSCARAGAGRRRGAPRRRP